MKTYNFRNVSITDFVFNGEDFFSANLNNGYVRVGLKGQTSFDVPPNHSYYPKAKDITNESQAETVFYDLISGMGKFYA